MKNFREETSLNMITGRRDQKWVYLTWLTDKLVRLIVEVFIAEFFSSVIYSLEIHIFALEFLKITYVGESINDE